MYCIVYGINQRMRSIGADNSYVWPKINQIKSFIHTIWLSLDDSYLFLKKNKQNKNITINVIFT